MTRLQRRVEQKRCKPSNDYVMHSHSSTWCSVLTRIPTLQQPHHFILQYSRIQLYSYLLGCTLSTVYSTSHPNMAIPMHCYVGQTIHYNIQSIFCGCSFVGRQTVEAAVPGSNLASSTMILMDCRSVYHTVRLTYPWGKNQTNKPYNIFFVFLSNILYSVYILNCTP